MKALVLISLLMASTVASATTSMVCKDQSVIRSLTIKGNDIEVLQTVSSGKTYSALKSVKDLKNGVLYLGDEYRGMAFSFESCQSADYRGISGVAGQVGFRLLEETVAACQCK